MKFFDHFTQQRVEFNFKFGRADRIGPIATPVEAPKPTGDDWTYSKPSDLKHSRAPKSKLLSQYDTKVEVAKKPTKRPLSRLSITEQEEGWLPWCGRIVGRDESFERGIEFPLSLDHSSRVEIKKRDGTKIMTEVLSCWWTWAQEDDSMRSEDIIAFRKVSA